MKVEYMKVKYMKVKYLSLINFASCSFTYQANIRESF